MKHDPRKQHRRSIRLTGYDYSQAGAYFVTICTKGRECVLDDPIVEGIIFAVWHALSGWFPTIELAEFVVMPNHVHLIVWILSPDEVEASLADTNGVGANGASEIELNAIRQYIIDNPAKWAQDRDNPIHIRPAAETVAAYLNEAGL